MKVVHFTSAHPAMDVRIFGRECRTLARAGYEVTIVAPRRSGKTYNSSSKPMEDGVYEGVTVRQFPCEKSRWRAITYNVWRVLRLLNGIDGDLYHFHDPELILVGLFMRLKGKRVVYDSHENSSETILTAKWIPPRLRGVVQFVFRACETFVASRMSAVVTANDAISSRFSGINKNVVRIGNFPLLRDFDGNFDPDTARHAGEIINFGGISPHTCAEQIVNAIALLNPTLGARLIVGGLTFSRPLLEQLSAMPVWNNVDFIGLVTRNQIIEHLRTASIATVLYSPEPNHFGVGSNRFFEALAAGIPVITSNFPAWREIVEGYGCGLTVDPNDPRAIAGALDFLLSHPDEATEMGRRGQQAFREKFNWEHEEQALLRLYEKVIGSPPLTSPVACHPELHSRAS